MTGRITLGLGIITALYVLALWWVDSRNQVFDGFVLLSSALPLMLLAAFLSFVVRFARWRWLLLRAGNRLPVMRGLLVYLAGLAFTATPGKVGELVRIRYCALWSIPPWKVIAAYVFERALDLLVVLALASLVIKRQDLLISVACFALFAVGLVVLLALYPNGLEWCIRTLTSWRATRLARLLQTLRDGLVGCRIWFHPLDLLVGAALGLAAWLITSLAFVYLVRHLG
ncbi:MAG: lysylphosphatidylglycerol synthase domain-containing protein, partial [Steroidobacteraceae bacterium]